MHARLWLVCKPIYLYIHVYILRKKLSQSNCAVQNPITGDRVDFHKLVGKTGR